MYPVSLDALLIFIRIAKEGSFTSAAQSLGISNSAASYTVRQIEKKLGTRLFNRTTRSLSLTEAGNVFLSRVQPLLEGLEQAFGDVGRAGGQTMGTLRLNVPPSAIPLVITPLLKDFLDAYPEVKVDVMVDNSLVDIVSKGYDAGIRYDNVLAQGMVAIPLITDMRFCIVGSPSYFAGRARPRHPQDLLKHECVNYRSASTDATYRWEFEKGGEKLRIAVNGRLATNDNNLILQAAVNGVGLSYLQYRNAEPYIRAGQLINVLDNWIPRTALYLYYYNPSGMPQKLRVFIDFARANLAARRAAE